MPISSPLISLNSNARLFSGFSFFSVHEFFTHFLVAFYFRAVCLYSVSNKHPQHLITMKSKTLEINSTATLAEVIETARKVEAFAKECGYELNALRVTNNLREYMAANKAAAEYVFPDKSSIRVDII